MPSGGGVLLLDLAYRVRRWLLRTTGWRTRGVKVMVFDPAGRLLLVRNSYGAAERWALPGGGMKRGEAPDAAARREVREETGCALADLAPVGVFDSEEEGWRDTIHLFRGTTTDQPHGDGWEIAAVGFFAPDALPAGTTAATRRRLAELKSGATPGRW